MRTLLISSHGDDHRLHRPIHRQPPDNDIIGLGHALECNFGGSLPEGRKVAVVVDICNALLGRSDSAMGELLLPILHWFSADKGSLEMLEALLSILMEVTKAIQITFGDSLKMVATSLGNLLMLSDKVNEHFHFAASSFPASTAVA